MYSRLTLLYVAILYKTTGTPLNGIIGMTTLALESQLNSEQHNFIEASLNCAESLLSIVNNILDYTKVTNMSIELSIHLSIYPPSNRSFFYLQIEAGKMEIERVLFNMRDVVEETARILAIKADEKDLEIIVHYPTTSNESFIGDPNRIRQVYR